MKSLYLILLHAVVLGLSAFFFCGFENFYVLFHTISTNKFLHLLHVSLFGHIILSIGFGATKKLLGTLTDSEFSSYNEKATSVLTDVLMLSGIVSHELSLQSIVSLCLLYAFISFSWTLNIKAQRCASIRVILGSTAVFLLAGIANQRHFFSNSLISILICMEYLMLMLSILKNQLFMFMDIKKEETNRSLYSFVISIFYLFFKCLIFAAFIYKVSQRTKFPYGTLKSLITTASKLYKKLVLFKKYLKLLKDLNSIEEVQVDSTCAICTDDIETGKRLSCSHVFHASCLKMWCEREVSCPICRAELVFRKEETVQAPNVNEILTGVPIDVMND